jgi:hypothetical protein
MHLKESRPANSQNIGQQGAGLATLFPCLRVRKKGSLTSASRKKKKFMNPKIIKIISFILLQINLNPKIEKKICLSGTCGVFFIQAV